MGFRRVIFPEATPTDDQLVAAMAGIGMRLAAAEPNYQANIEDTIYFASVEGMDNWQFRKLFVLTNWIEVYSRIINVSRLLLLVKKGSDRVRAYWTAVARWRKSDHRFVCMSDLYKGSRFTLDDDPALFLFEKHGNNPRFEGGPLLVPGNVLAWRERDVSPIDWSVQKNPFIRQRLIIGPISRADMWALLDLNPELTPSELARRSYGSFSSAWRAREDWRLVHGRK